MGAKKRRRNGGRVNKRRNLNDVRERYSKKSPFANKAVMSAWDFSKTVNQNYESIGLLGGNLNDLPRRDDNLTDKGKPAPLGNDSVVPKQPIQFVSGIMASSMPSLRQQLDARASGDSSRGQHHMSVLEKAYIAPLVEKYGMGNWYPMSKDMKLNYKQLTREKLRRKCERYGSLLEQEEIDRLEAEEEEEEEDEEDEEEEEEDSSEEEQ